MTNVRSISHDLSPCSCITCSLFLLIQILYLRSALAPLEILSVSLSPYRQVLGLAVSTLF